MFYIAIHCGCVVMSPSRVRVEMPFAQTRFNPSIKSYTDLRRNPHFKYFLSPPPHFIDFIIQTQTFCVDVVVCVRRCPRKHPTLRNVRRAKIGLIRDSWHSLGNFLSRCNVEWMTCLHSSSASPLTLYSRQTISFDGALYLATYIDTTVSIYTLICCILCRKLASYDDGLQRTRKKKEDCEMRPHSGNIAAQFRKLRLVLLLRSLSSHVQCPFLA